MTTRLCDRCGQLIEPNALRFVAKIQVYAAYDPINVSFDELTRDHSEEIREIIRRCDGLTEDELMRDVYVDFEFDLCHACQRIYIANPLPPADDDGDA